MIRLKTDLKHRIYGIVLSVVYLIIVIIFMFLLIKTALFTTKLIVLAGTVLFFVTAGIFVLVFDSRKKVKTVIGTVLALISIALQITGAYYISTGASALEDITAPSQEYSEVGVYVLKDDTAKSIEDTKGYTFGILDVLDRTTTDEVIAELEKLLGGAIQIKTYSGVSELLDAFIRNGEVKAILLNLSLLDIVVDTGEHENDIALMRLLYFFKVAVSEGFEKPEYFKPKDHFIVYITGVDCYGGISRRSRSDVNILATVNKKTGQILLISTPRDYFVPLSISNGVPDKLTHAGVYGTNVSRDTIAMLYGIDIDYYFKVNFDGFKGIIDALGGVTVNSEYAFKAYKYSFVQGENFMDGETALVFSRERYQLAGGDRQRGKNQMAVIKGIINKAMSPALLTNYSAVLEGVKGSFETDMPYEMISHLVQNQLENGTKWNTVSFSVDGTGSSAKPYSLSRNAYVMLPKQETVDKAKTLINQVINGEIPTP